MLLLFVMVTACLASAQAQLSPSKLLQPNEQPTGAVQAPADPLGRQTPRGAIFGFLEAAQKNNYRKAADYLQMSKSRRAADGEELSQQLQAVLDRGFQGALASISDRPEGTPQEGLPPDREKVGVLAAGGDRIDLLLARVSDPDYGQIWLVSSATLAAVPELYQKLQSDLLEKYIPKSLVENAYLGMGAWQWLGMAVLIPLAAGAAWLLIQLVLLPRRFWSGYRKGGFTLHSWAAVSSPIWLLIAVLLHAIGVHFLRIPLLHRHQYFLVANIIFTLAATWLALRLVSTIMDRLRTKALASGRSGTGSLIVLGQRILKVVLLVISGLVIMATLGFNLTTALAGLGIGGIAIAFAAQKTLENLFGGVSVLGDEVIRIGDVCQFGDRVGTITDISLRSTRIRTLERSELSIPNGSLATMNVENLSLRDKFIMNPAFGMRYDTTPDQLRYVLAEIRRMLYEHPKIETQGARVRFAGLDSSALRLEMFCYVLTTDFADFAAVREDVLLRIMDIVKQAGTGFAFPSQTLYLTRDPGTDKAVGKAAEQTVESWREEHALPFPDFAPEKISDLRHSITYPPAESAVRKRPS
jgi:MscS family membrane protein